jgi:predicted ABC-type ATPase
MGQKRLRVFAGPNGSGKSRMVDTVRKVVELGCFINADEIEKLITQNKGVNLKDYNVKSETKKLYEFFDVSDLAKNKSKPEDLKKIFSIHNNILRVEKTSIVTPKYSAAIIAEFLRECNLTAGNDFSFETVLSHKNKIEFIKRANEKGYHVYLYFICTDDVRVNIERVKARVELGGHTVPEVKIKERYIRTLDLLYDVLKVCYKSYLFDNSDEFMEIARIDRDKTIQSVVKLPEKAVYPISVLPNWFINSVIKKIKLP